MKTCVVNKHILAYRLLIGAPRGRSSDLPSTDHPGALYRCNVSDGKSSCMEIRIDGIDNFVFTTAAKFEKNITLNNYDAKECVRLDSEQTALCIFAFAKLYLSQ